MESYQKLASIPVSVLNTMDIDKDKIIEKMNIDINGLKKSYWGKVFDKFSKINERLSYQSREELKKDLLDNVNISFNTGNINSVVCWVINHSNRYIEKQLCDIYKEMSNEKNTVKYKSNLRFKDYKWRCCTVEEREGNCNYKLDYRFINSTYYGLAREVYNHSFDNSIQAQQLELLSDFHVIARNLGFNVDEFDGNTKYDSQLKKWQRGENKDFFFTNAKGEKEIFMAVRYYQNGNIHVKFNKQFMLAFNVEVGRLLGWLRTPEQASEELQETVKKVKTVWNSNKVIEASNIKLLA